LVLRRLIRQNNGGNSSANTSLRAVFGALFLALLLAALDQPIVGELGARTHLFWLVTAYLLTSTVAGPFYGKLGDVHGRKIVLQAAIVVFLLGSVLCGIAQNMVEQLTGQFECDPPGFFSCPCSGQTVVTSSPMRQ
jgi:MFS family permease